MSFFIFHFPFRSDASVFNGKMRNEKWKIWFASNLMMEASTV